MEETANSGEVAEQAEPTEQANEAAEQPTYEDKIKEVASKAGWKPTGPMDAEEFLTTMPDRF